MKLQNKTKTIYVYVYIYTNIQYIQTKQKNANNTKTPNNTNNIPKTCTRKQKFIKYKLQKYTKHVQQSKNVPIQNYTK